MREVSEGKRGRALKHNSNFLTLNVMSGNVKTDGSHSSTGPTRVGYVLKCYPRYSETFIVNEILIHEKAGLEIEIFALRHPRDTHFQNILSRVRAPVTYLNLPEEGLNAIYFWNALEQTSDLLPDLWAKLEAARGEQPRDIYQSALLARLVRLRNIDHLHAHFATSATSVARLAAHFAGLPYSFTAHAKDIFHENTRHDDLRRKLNDAASVITVSNYNLTYLRECYGEAAARVQRIYNGLDLDEFPYNAPHDRPPLIVSIGRLIEKKGFADLIEACAILSSQNYQFQCRIVGAGPLEADLHAQIGRLGLESKIEMLGLRPQSEVINLIQSASVLVAPSVVGKNGDRDGLPTVLLEAMALGTPCVSTDLSGIPEVLHDGETGFMVPQHNPSVLAGVLKLLLSNADLRVQLALRARNLIEAEFDIRRNAAHHRQLYQGVDRAVIAAAAGVT